MEARHVDADKLAERVHVEVETVHAWLQGTEMPDMEIAVAGLVASYAKKDD